MPNKKHLASIIILNLYSLASGAQLMPDSTIKQIENIFSKWNRFNSPGCVVGIVRHDSLIYSKGFGLANLEYDIKNTPETMYHMASVSKQFTAFSILLLAKQGKLSLEDDVRIYLPWFPDLKEKITIRHLLNHTSGIRDQWQLLAIAGTRLDDVIKQEHIIKILSNQKALNFKPGEKNIYSNSGYTMLSEIVKSITGQSLRKFTDSAIFKPLQMHQTHFHDNYTEIEKNRAYSYSMKDSMHFANEILSYSNSGATSLFSNVNDMSKWIINYFKPTLGNSNDILNLTTKGKLADGSSINYGMGIGIFDYKGYTVFGHNGADAGYRTVVVIFPELQYGFIIFSNVDEFDIAGSAFKLADIFIENKAIKAGNKLTKRLDSIQTNILDTMSIRKYLGTYISEDGTKLECNLVKKKFQILKNGQLILLVPFRKDTFQVFTDSLTKFVFTINSKGGILARESWPKGDRSYAKYKLNQRPGTKELKEYLGNYYCPELDCNYTIVSKNDKLILTHNKYKDKELEFCGPENLLCDYWWMSHLTISRDNENRITGFEVNNGRVMHLKFYKRK